MALEVNLRVSDADREAVAEGLRQHYAVGRLTDSEFDERTTTTYAATTSRDLDGLLTDMPRPATPWCRPDCTTRPSRPHATLRDWPVAVGVLMVVVVWMTAPSRGSREKERHRTEQEAHRRAIVDNRRVS